MGLAKCLQSQSQRDGCHVDHTEYQSQQFAREIQAHLLELYGTEVSRDLFSTIADEVLEEVTQWQQRPLEAMYPVVYFDALRLKIPDEGTVKNKAVKLALGIRADGGKDGTGFVSPTHTLDTTETKNPQHSKCGGFLNC